MTVQIWFFHAIYQSKKQFSILELYIEINIFLSTFQQFLISYSFSCHLITIVQNDANKTCMCTSVIKIVSHNPGIDHVQGGVLAKCVLLYRVGVNLKCPTECLKANSQDPNINNGYPLQKHKNKIKVSKYLWMLFQGINGLCILNFHPPKRLNHSKITLILVNNYLFIYFLIFSQSFCLDFRLIKCNQTQQPVSNGAHKFKTFRVNKS